MFPYSSFPLRPLSPVEAPVWSWFPRHFQDPWPVAGRPRGGGGGAFWPRLRQPRGPWARAGRARVGHALAPPAKHFPGEGMGEEWDERHRGPPGSETGSEREIPDPRLCGRIYSPAQPLHGGQREEKQGHGAEAARQTGTAASEESGRLIDGPLQHWAEHESPRSVNPLTDQCFSSGTWSSVNFHWSAVWQTFTQPANVCKETPINVFQASLVFSSKHLRSAVASFESYTIRAANTEPHLCATVWMNICLLKVFSLSSFTHCTSLQSWVYWNKILYIWNVFVWLVFFPCSFLNV